MLRKEIFEGGGFSDFNSSNKEDWIDILNMQNLLLTHHAAMSDLIEWALNYSSLCIIIYIYI